MLIVTLKDEAIRMLVDGIRWLVHVLALGTTTVLDLWLVQEHHGMSVAQRSVVQVAHYMERYGVS